VQDGRGDNDIKLIAGKATVLRLYLDGPLGFSASHVNGSLKLRPVGLGPQAWTTIDAYNNPILVRPRDRIYRADPSRTLNFRLPTSLCEGALEVLIQVSDAASREVTRIVAQKRLVFYEVTPPQVYLVGIESDAAHYGAAPTEAQARQLLKFAERIFPAPYIQVVGYEVLRYTKEVDKRNEWSKLLTAIQKRRQSSKKYKNSQVRYLGVFRRECLNTLPVFGSCTDDVTGQARPSKMVAAAVGLEKVVAHELGHLYGFGVNHVAGCYAWHHHWWDPKAKDPDPGYPPYCLPGSIGEYGFHTSTGAVYGPCPERYQDLGTVSAHYDIMTYCDRKWLWISPYTYERIMSVLVKKTCD
jgi:hypothetical protein